MDTASFLIAQLQRSHQPEPMENFEGTSNPTKFVTSTEPPAGADGKPVVILSFPVGKFASTEPPAGADGKHRNL